MILVYMNISFLAFSQWQNPITVTGDWANYGIGDPFIMKYRGTYYLYSSTKDGQTGVKYYTSKDLVNWSAASLCSTDAITTTAYAPEVFYWNGTFYMYTSPAGNGHYVLTSTSPTGPFVVATGNLAHSIDGDVFIDDDGSWYFYHAGTAGIYACTMSSPTTIATGSLINCVMNNNWTEGPSVFKRNGTYYITYTGNHVWSYGYRTDYAKNTSSPTASFTPQKAQNPILINAEGYYHGLGHGSVFIGPDLDSYYFVYHCFNVVPHRYLNIDRIAFNGDEMSILGPTTWSQQAPGMPVASDYFNRATIGSDWTLINAGNWGIYNQDLMYQDKCDESVETWHKAIYNTSTAANYTAEFTIKEVSRTNNAGRLGAVFGYADEQNYGIALFHSYTNQLEINFLVNNTWGTPQYYSLPSGWNYNVWHSLRIQKRGTNYKFFVDGMLKANITGSLGAGKIGYLTSWSHGDFSYIAFSNQVNGSAIFDTYKPIPGTISAVHYNTGGEGVGYHDLTTGNTGGKYTRADDVDIRESEDGGMNIGWNQTGEWYKYNVNVQSTGEYNVGLRYATNQTACQVRIWQGTTDVSGIIDLPYTGGFAQWDTYTIKGLNLTAGYQTLRIETVTGEFDFKEFQFKAADNSQVTIQDQFASSFSTDWNYSDGTWSISSGQASINGHGKRTMGNIGWSDYTVETDVTYLSGMNAGLIFRVTEPALGGAGNDPALGTDFYKGYFVTLGSSAVVLGKENYSWTLLSTASGTYSLNTTYHLKIVMKAGNIKVYVNDMNTAKIDYTDSIPFINGKVGLRSCNTNVLFDNFTVTTDGYDNTLVTGTNNIKTNNSINVYSNPEKETLTILNLSKKTTANIYDLSGKLLLTKQLNTNDAEINVSQLKKGIYIIKLSNETENTVVKQFIE